MNYQLYRASTLGTTLQATLDEMVHVSLATAYIYLKNYILILCVVIVYFRATFYPMT